MARAQWGSKLGFILAATGSAVGLGAIWKFPYVTAHQGGGAFLLLFTALTLFIGLALLRVEIAIGRAGQSDAFGSYRNLSPNGWAIAGLLGVLASCTILSYYSVVGGWTIAYAWQTVTTPLSQDANQLQDAFATFSSDTWRPLLFHALFLLATLGGVIGGIQNGIERLAKVLMPALFVMMCVLIVRGLLLPGSWEGVREFLAPDFTQLDMSAFLTALGLSFWTLSLALGIMVTYGSYLPPDENVNTAARAVALLTLLSCFLGGLLVLPPAVALGLDQGAGPGLTFITMPIVFAHLPWGNAFGTVFFLLLFVAALTSSISMLEVAVAFLIEHTSLKRRGATIVTAIVLYMVGAVASLSLGSRPTLQPGDRSVFDWLDLTASNVLLPVGGMLTGLFGAWVVWPTLVRQLNWENASARQLLVRRAVIGVVAPLAIAIILWHGVN